MIMHQLTQQLKSGKMELLEVPFPVLGKGNVVVRNYYSVISAGTEGKTVKDARLGYIGKAKTRQKEVKQVIETVSTAGLANTYKMVMNKLEAPSALGYCCAGEVISVGGDVKDLKVGDKVACGGQGAYHAEVVSVNRNLCVKIPDTVDPRQAAFAAVASIAIQGIRQADLRFGESCCVVGLGLIGQITIQVLNAAGVKSIGVDISDAQVKLAEACGADLALNRDRPGLEKTIYDFTDGFGTDAVIITAGTSSNDPVKLAGRICRQKGKVVIVGAVPTGFSREHYYKKELDLRMSCSYGPGRYDPEYEERSIDYPIGYVRWTENRNMQAFVDLLSRGKLNIEKLITHTFPFEKASDAYQMILDRSEVYAGILLEYDLKKEIKPKRIIVAEKTIRASEPNVGLIGAGSFAQNFLLPRMKGLCNMIGVATARGNNSRYVADKFRFNYCTDNPDDIFEDNKINTVFIFTRHNFHAHNIIKGLKAGKHVFVEKPLAMNIEELESVREAYDKQKDNCHLMLGFNRRFSPHVQKIKELFSNDAQKAINIRMNARAVPDTHWVHDPKVGGGRIIGEVCHFIDLAMFFAGAEITSVFANNMYDVKGLCDTVSISLKFSNGSVASISYFSNGNSSLSKEYIEVFCNGQVAVIDDFKKMTIHGKKKAKFNLSFQNKGHKEEVEQFFRAIKNGSKCPVPFQESYLSTLATFAVIDSIKNNTPINPLTVQLKKE